jgi:nucleoid DNA-binding protein
MSEHRTTLIESVQKTLSLSSKADANRCISAVIDGLSAIITKEGKKADFRFAVSGLGVFKSKEVPQQNRRDPRTGEAVLKDARVKVQFRFGKELREVGIKAAKKVAAASPAKAEKPAKAAKK